MKEVIDNIMEKISFKRKDLFRELVAKSIEVVVDPEDELKSEEENEVIFKLQFFFNGFSPFNNEHGKDLKYNAGVEALYVICNELGLEVDKSDCFLLFHIKNLGKFRMKETVLHSELKSLWGRYKEYVLTDNDFSYTLKSLMRKRFIQYRKGNLHLNKIVRIRYRS